MTAERVKPVLLSAATAAAVAAGVLLFNAWMATGPGVAMAKWSEVAFQHLPGGWPDAAVEAEWSSPGSLNAMGLLVYEERPTGFFGVCAPGLLGVALASVAAALGHGVVCAVVARVSGWPARPGGRSQRLYGRSAVYALWVPLLVCAARWAWAGAARGSITQRTVGGEHVDFAFGPFGRFSVLAGGALIYLAVVAWTACRMRPGITEAQPLERPAPRRVRAAASVAVAGCALLLFPYWGPQATRVIPQSAAVRIGEWSEASPLRSVLDGLAPMP